MSLESIEQKAKAVLEAYYELERLKIRNAPGQEIAKRKSYMKSLLDGIKAEALSEKV